MLDVSRIVIQADAFRFEQVLANLLTNAAKYAAGKPIQLLLERAEQHAVVTIRDEGPGIPEDRLAHIFERFERRDTGTRVGGLGLGLYISKEIVGAHGGTIRVESQWGRGSNFIVHMPLASPAALAS